MNSTIPRIILLCVALFLPVQALNVPPRPHGPVGDYAHVLDTRTVQTLTDLNTMLYNKTGFSLVIATIPSLEETTIEEYATTLYEKWGIGTKKKDEGALILLSLNPRRVRIEVGYGAEGYLNDAKVGRLLDMYALPAFRQNNYNEGMLNLAAAVAQIAAQEKNVALEFSPPGANRQSDSQKVRLSPLQMLFAIVLLILLVSTRFGRSLLFWILLSGMMGGRRQNSSGGFGGGFGGGGFGGFGGGMSGGGGASRSF